MAVRKVEGYTLLFLEIFIIILNSLAIIVIFRFKRKCNPDILIFSLAVADLLKAFIPLNMTLVAYLADNGAMAQSSSYSCKIFGWTAFTLNSGIMLVMTIMAIDRYIAMCWPFRYKDLLSKKRLICTIIAAFVFSGTYSALPLVGVGRIQSYHNGSFCHFDFDSTKPLNKGYNIFVLVLGISMLLVVIFCYTRAMLSVRGLIKRQRRMSTRARDVDGSEQRRQTMNRMFARLMIVMMVVFCLSWLLFLLVILQHVTGWFELPSTAHFWSMRLAVLNSVLNPLIGAAMCKPYRKGYLFILCKLLHCCGLCSSYQAVDPWTNTRRFSLSWRNSLEKEPQTPTTNDATLKKDPSFSWHDSGIVPDSSIGYHQGGVINGACEKSSNQADGLSDIDGGDKPSIRPRLQRKRISFKDEVEATQAGLSLEQQQGASSAGCPPDETAGEVFSLQQGGNASTIPISSSQSPSKFTLSTGAEMKSDSIDKSQERDLPGIFEPSAYKLQEFTSLINRPENTDLVFGHASTEQNSTAEKETSNKHEAPLEKRVMTESQQPLGIKGAPSEILPKDPIERNKTKLNEIGKGRKDPPWQNQSMPSKDDDDDETVEATQVTHFPVNVNLNAEPGSTAVQNMTHRFLPSSSTSDSIQAVKPRSKSFTNDHEVADRTEDSCLSENKTQSQAESMRRIAKQALDTGPATTKSSFHRTKSCDSELRRKAHRPSFQRQSRLMKSEQSEPGVEGTPRCSESHRTRSLPEIVLNSNNETQNTGDSKCLAAGEKSHSLGSVTPHGEIKDSPPRKASDPQTTRSASKIYMQLSELSPKELEREVFC